MLIVKPQASSRDRAVRGRVVWVAGRQRGSKGRRGTGARFEDSKPQAIGVHLGREAFSVLLAHRSAVQEARVEEGQARQHELNEGHTDKDPSCVTRIDADGCYCHRSRGSSDLLERGSTAPQALGAR